MTAPRWDEAGPTPVVSPPAPGGVLRVDPEQVDGVLQKLSAVIDELWGLERQFGFYRIASPGSDPVSTNMATQASVMMERGRDYIAAWRQQLVVTRDAIEQQRVGYTSADSAIRA
jgi:hypothetical protein